MTRMSVSQAYKTLWGTGIIFVFIPHLNLGLLSDYKICGDAGCESPMSTVLAIRDHHGKDCRFLNFRRGDTISVYHKLTGNKEDLWGGSIDKQFGYFPKDAVQVKRVHARTEQRVETQESDFFCTDAFGYPIDSSHLDSDDDDDEKIPNQESEITKTTPHSDNTNTESLSKSEVVSTEPQVSSKEVDRTWTPESGDQKDVHDAHEAPAAPNEQGGSASSAWLGSSVKGWLGLSTVEEPGTLAEGEKKADGKETQAEASLTSSVTAWLGMSGEEQHDDTVKSGEKEKETPHSFTSTVSGWLGFGEEKKTDDSEAKERDEERENDDDEEPAEKFRSRRMSLNLEGSQLHEEEKEETGTLDWLGKGLSDQLGFGLTNQASGHESTAEREDKETIQGEEEQPASGSWFDMGMGDILGFKKDKKEVEENTISGFNEPEKHKTTEVTAGSDNMNAGQSQAAPSEEGRTETSNEKEVEGIVKDQNVPSEEETVPDSADSVDSNDGTSDSSKDSVQTENTASEDRQKELPSQKVEEKSQAVSGMSSMLSSIFQIGSEEEKEHEGLDDQTEETKTPDGESSAEMEDEDHKRPKSTEDVGDDNNITDTGKGIKTTEMESPDMSAKISSSSDAHEGGGSNAEPDVFQTEISATQTDEKIEKSMVSGETQLFLSSDTDVQRNQPASNQDEEAHSKETTPDESDTIAVTDTGTEAENRQSELGPEGDGNALDESFLEVGSSLSRDQSTDHRSADNTSPESPHMQLTEKDGPQKVEPVPTETERPGTVTDTEEVEVSKNEEEQRDVEELKDDEGVKALEQQQELEEEQTVVKKIDERGIQAEVEVEQEGTLDEVEMREGMKEQGEIKEEEKQGDEFKAEVEEEKEGENEFTKQVGEEQFKEEEKQLEEEEKLKEEEKQQEVKVFEEEAIQEEEAQEAVELIKDNKKQEEIKEEDKQQQTEELKEETQEKDEEGLKEEEKQQEVKDIEEEAKKEEEAQETVENKKKEEIKEGEKQQQTDVLKEETQEVEEVEEELKEKENQQELKDIEEKAKQEEEAQEVVELIKDNKKQEEIKEEEQQQQTEELKEETKEEEEEEVGEEEKQMEVKEIEKEGKLEETEEVEQEEVAIREEGKQEEEFKDVVELQTEGVKRAASEVVDELKEGKEDLKEEEEIKVKEENVVEGTQVEMETSLRSSLDQEKDTDRTESESNERETEGETSFNSDTQTEVQEEVKKVKEEMKGEEDEENLGPERKSTEEEMLNLKCSNETFSKARPDRFLRQSDGENSGNNLSSTDEAEIDTGKQNQMADSDQMLADKTGGSQNAPAEGLERDEDEEQEGVKRNDDGDNKDGNEDDKSETSTSLSELKALGVTAAERSGHSDDHLLYSGERGPDKNEVSSDQRAENKEEEQDFNETKNSDPDPERTEKSSGGINTEQIHIVDTKKETDSDENRINTKNDAAGVNSKSEQLDPHVSQHPTSSSLISDGHSNKAETERGGAFGLFQKAFSFFRQEPATEPAAPSVDVTTGETSAVHISLIPEQEVDSSSNSAQLDIQYPPIPTQQHLQPTLPPSTETSSSLAETLSHPIPASPTTGSPLQSKTLSKNYKSLLTDMSVEEKTILMELFGRHKLQFLDYILSSEMIEADNDESILLDIERLLHHHKEGMAAQSVGNFDSPQEGKENSRMLIALQKLEILLAGVRETFNTKRSVANRQAEASRETNVAGDSSVFLDHSTPRDEWTGVDIEKDGHQNRGGLTESPDSHPHVQTEPPQPSDGTAHSSTP